MALEFINDKLAFGTHNGAVFSFNKKEMPSTVQVEIRNSTGKLVSWGPNNDTPQKIMEGISKSGTAKAALRFNKKVHYGNGLVFTKEDFEKGSTKKKIIPVSLSDYPEIAQFFRKNKMKRFFQEAISDLETFSFANPEYILSADFNKINRVRRQKTAWCRFEVMNETTGYIDYVYLSQRWGTTNNTEEDKYTKRIRHIDPYWTPEEVKDYCRKHKITNFIRPSFYPTTIEGYYPVADWHTIIESGWIDVANSIPEYKKAMFKNQISIKYLIEIDERYFEQVYKDVWEDFSVDERKDKRKEVIDAIDTHLGGSSEAGKSIQSMKIDVGDGQTVSAITITPIDDKFKDGAYLPEASAANGEILFAFSVDPSVIGAGIPGGLGAGSGSDKREAFTIASALMKTNRETTLEIYDFIAEYNNWDPLITPHFENTILTTLDKNPTGTQNAVN